MKKLLVMLTLAAGLCGALVWLPDACGQNGVASRTGKPHEGSRIASIDLELILKSYRKWETVQQQLEAEFEAGRARVHELSAQGQEKEKAFRDSKLDRDSPEYAECEKELVQLDTSISRLKTANARDVKQHKARALMAIFRDVSDAVRQIAETNGYTLVLLVNHEAMLAQSYTTIDRSMTQNVIRHTRRDEITDAVISYLNKHYQAAEMGPEAGTNPGSNGAAAKPAPANRRKTPPAR